MLRTLGGRLRDRFADWIWERRAIPAEYRERLRLTITGWVKRYYEDVLLDGAYWMGVRSLKNPLDAWTYQEIMYETRPDLLLELGSAYGGSAQFFSNMFDLLGNDGKVVTVDLSHDQFGAEHDRITTVTGDTRDPNVIERVRSLCAGRR